MRAFLKRLLDRIQHHYEFPTQRQYRRYLEGLDHAAPAEPYVFPGVATVTEGGTWGQWAQEQKALRDSETHGPIVGVRMDLYPPTTSNHPYEGAPNYWRNDLIDEMQQRGMADKYGRVLPAPTPQAYDARPEYAKRARPATDEQRAYIEDIRTALHDENVSMAELIDLQGMAEQGVIEPGDIEMLEAAGVSEWEATGYGEGNPTDDVDPMLTCDLCGKREWSGDLTPDWNGETGNHFSCEDAAQHPYYAQPSDDEEYDPADPPEGYRTDEDAAVRYAEDKWDREASR